MMKPIFRKAETGDLEAVRALYRSAIGRDGCTWSEDYPDEEELQGDFGAGCLYVLAENGEVIGAASVAPENELDELDVWRARGGAPREIARVVVAAARQHEGMARLMLSRLLEQMAREGCGVVHILVAEHNAHAIALYKSLGFRFLCVRRLYGHDFFCCERVTPADDLKANISGSD